MPYPPKLSDTETSIRDLNDQFRQTFEGGQVMMTSVVTSLEEKTRFQIVRAIQSFSNFNADNDPYGTHEFGSIEIAGDRYFFKIDTFDPSLQYHSEDASNTDITARVMTIMAADEY